MELERCNPTAEEYDFRSLVFFKLEMATTFLFLVSLSEIFREAVVSEIYLDSPNE